MPGKKNDPVARKSTKKETKPSREDYLTDIERQHVQIVDDDGSVVLVYKPKSSKKKKKKNLRSVAADNATDGFAINCSTRDKRDGEDVQSTYKDQHQQRHLEESSRSGISISEIFLRDGSDREASIEGRNHQHGNDREQSSTGLERRSNENLQNSHHSCPVESVASHSGYKRRSFLKTLLHFKVLKCAQVLLAVYICILTFANIGPPGGLRDPQSGLIVDKASQERTEKGLILVHGTLRAIVADTKFQVACIGIARISAWFMYPSKDINLRCCFLNVSL